MVFLQDLYDVLREDHDEVWEEWRTLYHEEDVRKRIPVAQQLNIPVNSDEWTMEHKRRYRDYAKWVTGWPHPSTICDSPDEPAQDTQADKEGDNNNISAKAPTANDPPVLPAEDRQASADHLQEPEAHDAQGTGEITSQPSVSLDEIVPPLALTEEAPHPPNSATTIRNPTSTANRDTKQTEHQPPPSPQPAAIINRGVFFRLAVLILLVQIVIEVARRNLSV